MGAIPMEGGVRWLWLLMVSYLKGTVLIIFLFTVTEHSTGATSGGRLCFGLQFEGTVFIIAKKT